MDAQIADCKVVSIVFANFWANPSTGAALSIQKKVENDFRLQMISMLEFMKHLIIKYLNRQS